MTNIHGTLLHYIIDVYHMPLCRTSFNLYKERLSKSYNFFKCFKSLQIILFYLSCILLSLAIFSGFSCERCSCWRSHLLWQLDCLFSGSQAFRIPQSLGVARMALLNAHLEIVDKCKFSVQKRHLQPVWINSI